MVVLLVAVGVLASSCAGDGAATIEQWWKSASTTTAFDALQAQLQSIQGLVTLNDESERLPFCSATGEAATKLGILLPAPSPVVTAQLADAVKASLMAASACSRGDLAAAGEDQTAASLFLQNANTLTYTPDASIVTLPLADSGSVHTGPTTAYPGPSGSPAEGTVVVTPSGRYNLDAGADHYSVAQDLENLTGTSTGVEIDGDQVAALPMGVAGGYDTCMNMDGYEQIGQDVPWSRLTVGSQFCVKTTYSGLYVTLLTVSAPPANSTVSLRVDTWTQ